MVTAADLICPECGTCSIELQGGAASAEEADTGTCRHCGRSYDLAVLPTYEQRHAALVAAAAKDVCPACGGGPRAVRSLCDRNARECFFVVACEGCGDVRLA